MDLDEIKESTLPSVRFPTTVLKFDPSDVIRNIEVASFSFASSSEVSKYFLLMNFPTLNRPLAFKSKEIVTSNLNKTLFW